MNYSSQEVGALLQEVLDDMLEGFQVISSDWRYQYVNKTVATQGKSTPSELLGRTMMECYPGIENTEVYAKCKQCMETQQSVLMENEFVFPDKTTGWFQLYIHPIKDGFIILSIDITEYKRAQEALNESIKKIDVLFNSTIDRESHMEELKEEIKGLKEAAGVKIFAQQ